MRLLVAMILAVMCHLCFAAETNQPVVVLVHGDMFTNQSWGDVKKQLESAGIKVATPDLPGRHDYLTPKKITLNSSVAKLCMTVYSQHVPVVLVAQGQSGGVITQALDKCASRIKALVYIAAVAPLDGQTVLQQLSPDDHANLDATTRFDETKYVIAPNPRGLLKEMMMADLSDAAALKLIATMVPEPAGVAADTLHYPAKAFLDVPKYYIETSNDKMISIETQRDIQQAIHPVKVFTIKSSHVPFASQPSVLADDLIEIVKQNSDN